jgi:hypothetical protein
MLKSIIFNTLFLLVLGGVSYASGDVNEGEFGKEKPKNLILENAPVKEIKTFSLRSGLQFRGEQVINQKPDYNYINLNTSITYQKGQNSFVLPYKKTVLSRITFNPNIGLRSLF